MLPTGYIGMVDMVSSKNQEFMKLAVEELMRRDLGPFSADTDPEEAASAREKANEILSYEPTPPSGLFGPDERGDRGAAVVLPRLAKLFGVIFVLTLGVQFEATESFSFAARFVLDAWLLFAFALMVWVFRRLSDQGLNISLAWTAALATLVLVGAITDSVMGL